METTLIGKARAEGGLEAGGWNIYLDEILIGYVEPIEATGKLSAIRANDLRLLGAPCDDLEQATNRIVANLK